MTSKALVTGTLVKSDFTSKLTIISSLSNFSFFTNSAKSLEFLTKESVLTH